MAKLLMSFNQNKKLLLITEQNPLQQIYEAAQQFTSNPLVQYFDNDFEEWIDIDDSYFSKDKLKVLTKDGPSNVSYSSFAFIIIILLSQWHV